MAQAGILPPSQDQATPVNRAQAITQAKLQAAIPDKPVQVTLATLAKQEPPTASNLPTWAEVELELELDTPQAPGQEPTRVQLEQLQDIQELQELQAQLELLEWLEFRGFREWAVQQIQQAAQEQEQRKGVADMGHHPTLRLTEDRENEQNDWYRMFLRK